MTDVGGIIIDKAAHIVKIDGQEIDLSFKEFELLTYFVVNKGLALSMEKNYKNTYHSTNQQRYFKFNRMFIPLGIPQLILS